MEVQHSNVYDPIMTKREWGRVCKCCYMMCTRHLNNQDRRKRKGCRSCEQIFWMVPISQRFRNVVRIYIDDNHRRNVSAKRSAIREVNRSVLSNAETQVLLRNIYPEDIDDRLERDQRAAKQKLKTRFLESDPAATRVLQEEGYNTDESDMHAEPFPFKAFTTFDLPMTTENPRRQRIPHYLGEDFPTLPTRDHLVKQRTIHAIIKQWHTMDALKVYNHPELSDKISALQVKVIFEQHAIVVPCFQIYVNFEDFISWITKPWNKEFYTLEYPTYFWSVQQLIDEQPELVTSELTCYNCGRGLSERTQIYGYCSECDSAFCGPTCRHQHMSLGDRMRDQSEAPRSRTRCPSIQERNKLVDRRMTLWANNDKKEVDRVDSMIAERDFLHSMRKVQSQLWRSKTISHTQMPTFNDRFVVYTMHLTDMNNRNTVDPDNLVHQGMLLTIQSGFNSLLGDMTKAFRDADGRGELPSRRQKLLNRPGLTSPDEENRYIINNHIRRLQAGTVYISPTYSKPDMQQWTEYEKTQSSTTISIF